MAASSWNLSGSVVYFVIWPAAVHRSSYNSRLARLLDSGRLGPCVSVPTNAGLLGLVPNPSEYPVILSTYEDVHISWGWSHNSGPKWRNDRCRKWNWYRYKCYQVALNNLRLRLRWLRRGSQPAWVVKRPFSMPSILCSLDHIWSSFWL